MSEVQPLPPPLSDGRRAVLFAVRHRGDATADELADDLGVTVSAVRQHLAALAEHDLVGSVDVETEHRGPGRPQQAYHVTEVADALFPKAYGALTSELLGYLAEEDAATVDRLFERRRDARIAAARGRLDTKRSVGAKVTELARILDEDGYLATSEALGDGRYRIVEHNCAIANVARRYGQACTSEIDFIRAVLPGTSVQRVQHMVQGDRHCAYEITPE